MPTVSVIVPIYRIENYLRQCVDSVLSQTFADYELILVDDGSPDGCPVICDEYAAKDERIRVIHKKNGGLSDARNAGLDVAVGKYIYFLDGDDTIDQNLFEVVVPHMESGMDMVVFNYRDVYEDGRTRNSRFSMQGMFTLNTPEERRDFIIKTLLPYKIGWGAWSRMYVRDKIEKYSLRFADNRKIFAEDLYYCLCYCAHAEKILSIDACLYNYRQRENSIMAGQKCKLNMGRFNELGKAVLTYFQKFEDCKCLVECFQAIHYLIVAERLLNEFELSGLRAPEFRRVVKEDISDWPFFRTQICKQLRHPELLKDTYPEPCLKEQYSFMRYLMGGSYTLLRLRIKLIYFTKRL